MHHYNLDWGLQFHNRFDNFDLVSKLHMCQKHEMQIVFFRLFHCVFYTPPLQDQCCVVTSCTVCFVTKCVCVVQTSVMLMLCGCLLNTFKLQSGRVDTVRHFAVVCFIFSYKVCMWYRYLSC